MRVVGLAPVRPRRTGGRGTIVALTLPLLFLAACDGTDPIDPKPVEVTTAPPSLELRVGETSRISVSVQNGSLSVDWSSSHPSVVSVDGGGLVRGMSSGTATVTATSRDDPARSASTAVQVLEPVEVTISPSTVDLAVGETRQLTARVSNAGSAAVTWRSSNSAVAGVDANGSVSGVAEGTAVVTASSVEDPSASASATVTVTAGGEAECLTPDGELSVGGSVNGALSATDCSLDDGSYFDLWTLRVPSAAAVTIDLTSGAFDAFLFLLSADGATLLASDDDSGQGSNARIRMSLDAGTYLLVANSFSVGESGTYALSASSGGNGGSVTVSVSPAQRTLEVGGSHTLVATVTGTSDTRVEWSTSSAAVATVSSSGTVQGVSPGTAVIRATSLADPTASASAAVTVQQSQTSSVAIVVTNALLNAVNIEVNGVVQGSVPAAETRQTTVPWASSLTVDWSLVRTTIAGGRAVGDVISGTFGPIDDPGEQVELTIDARVGDAFIFRPLIANETSARLLMGVNEGLQSQNRCNCVVPAGSSGTTIGYYWLFSNTNVRAYRDGSSYTGSWIGWSGFANDVNRTTGHIRLRATSAPAAPPGPQGVGVGSGALAPEWVGPEVTRAPPSDVEDVPRKMPPRFR